MIRHVLPPLLIGLFVSAVACGGDDDLADDDGPGQDGGSSGASSGGSSGTTSSSGGSSSGDGGVQPNRVVCPTAIPAAPDGQLCAVTSGAADKLVIRATVLAGDTIYENGAVVVDRNGDNGTLSCVGCDCAAAGATELACAQGVLSPGLINAHDHMPYNVRGEPKGHGTERYDHRHDWREGKRGHAAVRHNGDVDDPTARQYAEMRMLMSGVTSLVGSGSAPGLVRNLDDKNADGSLDMGEVDYRTFPLGDASGTLRSSGCSYGTKDKASRLSARIYLPHIAEGIDAEAENEFKCLSGEGEGSVDVIAANTSIVHGIGLTAADISTIAQEGAKLVWSPRTNIDLYGQTADVLTYRRLGINIALGTDWIISGSMNLLRELQCVDSLNKTNYDNAFSDLEIWQMATKNGAIAMGVQERLGTIAQGYIADLALYDGRARRDHRAVIEAGVEDVALVLRGGKALYGDAAVIDGVASDPAKCEAQDVCTRGKKNCAELDTGKTLGAMETAAQPRYPLFACGTPEREPSCVPARVDEYTGVPGGNDSDGDGIDDDADNCSRIFNPRRPLDSNNQPNHDGDTFGDSCDVCPLNEGETCVSVDPNDRDGDGVANDADNCPTIANVDQADNDGDGKGDACDKCPTESNPGAAVCTATISEIKQNQKWAVGDVVRVRGSLVVGSGRDGLFLQAPGGGNYSGLFAYLTGTTKPAEGNIVDVTGRIADFNGQRQIEALTDITVVSESNPLPAPVVLTSAELVASSQRAKELEGTLVAVDGATVASFNSQYVEASMNGGDFLIDDTLFAYAPPAVGTEYDRVQGPLSFRFGANRINPRRDADLVVDADAPRRVASLTPASLTVPPGGSATLTVNLNLPAPAGGVVVQLAADPAALVNLPATVTVLEGTSSIAVTVAAVAADGAGSISAEVTGQSPAAAPAAFNIAVPAQECLIISEVVEGTSNNKAVEIFNCGGELDLSQFLLCQANRGDAGTQNQTFTLKLTGTLAASAMQVHCNNGMNAAVNCTRSANSVLGFNGNDSLYLVKDNGNGVCNPGVDPVVDAFGVVGGPMTANELPWSNKSYSRCDFTPFLGTGEFDIGTYKARDVDTFDGLGVAPIQGCE